jgi:hypothetical protein
MIFNADQGSNLTNPYSPPSSLATEHFRKRRWLRWALVLNGVLVAIPALIFLGAFL